MLALSASPTVVLDDVPVELPALRDQLTTRADARFTALRSRVLELIREGGGAGGRGPRDQAAKSARNTGEPSNPTSPR